ncbi:Oidioi.mRNA.OKI2018_I69.chr2.g7733.t1.cds [Oikopleura dioica]|uniref:Oidioi.mRNA.OKI2018_I69.chr2.g7733.t1.cds n=1 Tax=Oikopleura dioica TaxID=34765 RepID=A0ABN7T7M4_OIKDI|nr:Oidioi.mRNA.OKI2018_I69.chr2.g7733.t1.cds [Oikopleura dioica]
MLSSAEQLRQTTTSWNISRLQIDATKEQDLSDKNDEISMIEDMESTISTPERSPFSTGTDYEISSEIEDSAVWRSPFSVEKVKTSSLVPRRASKASSHDPCFFKSGQRASRFSSDNDDKKPVIKFLGYHNS